MQVLLVIKNQISNIFKLKKKLLHTYKSFCKYIFLQCKYSDYHQGHMKHLQLFCNVYFQGRIYTSLVFLI